MSFDAANISVVKDGQSLVKDASFTLKPGELTVLLGPNGAGKTSLLQASLGIERPNAGTAMVDGHNIASLSPQARARKISYLPQTRPLAWPARAADIVALGRFAYGASPARLGDDDRRAIDKAITACELTHLAERAADTLSGGELARLHFARTLAAQTDYLIADEPVAALDPQHQFRILDLIRSYVDTGNSALIILHDINLAARYADQLLWMKDGEIVARGSVKDSLSPERIEQIYNIQAEIKDGHVRLFNKTT